MKSFRRDFSINGLTLVNFVNLPPADRAAVRLMRNTPDVRRWMYGSRLISRQEHAAFLRGLGKDSRNYYWLVSSAGSRQGVVYLTRVCAEHKNAYLGIYTAAGCAQGTGSLLLEALCAIAFDYAALHTLKLEALASNKRALAFYVRNGFKVEGRLREFVRRHDGWEDVVIMGRTG